MKMTHSVEHYCHNIEELVEMFDAPKGRVKRSLLNSGCTSPEDYVIVHGVATKKGGGSKKGVVKLHRRGGHNKEDILMTERCYKQMKVTMALRRRDKVQNVDDIDLKIIHRYLPKETETLGFIYDIFSSNFNVKREFCFMNYRIDLYFTDHKLAIECDENGHKSYCAFAEEARENILKKHLGCTFIRFNPDDEHFSLARLVARINSVLYKPVPTKSN
jgi:very-short-patch-repair endonuclease